MKLYTLGFSFRERNVEYLGHLPPLLDGKLLIPMLTRTELEAMTSHQTQNYGYYLTSCVENIKARLLVVGETHAEF